MAITTEQLGQALNFAQDGEWEQAHKIVQHDDKSELACWLHAVLHKIEGDDDNARYWYRRTSHEFEDYADANEELNAIARATNKPTTA